VSSSRLASSRPAFASSRGIGDRVSFGGERSRRGGGRRFSHSSRAAPGGIFLDLPWRSEPDRPLAPRRRTSEALAPLALTPAITGQARARVCELARAEGCPVVSSVAAGQRQTLSPAGTLRPTIAVPQWWIFPPNFRVESTAAVELALRDCAGGGANAIGGNRPSRTRCRYTSSLLTLIEKDSAKRLRQRPLDRTHSTPITAHGAREQFPGIADRKVPFSRCSFMTGAASPRPEGRRRPRDGGARRRTLRAKNSFAKSFLMLATFAGSLVGVGRAGTPRRCCPELASPPTRPPSLSAARTGLPTGGARESYRVDTRARAQLDTVNGEAPATHTSLSTVASSSDVARAARRGSLVNTAVFPIVVPLSSNHRNRPRKGRGAHGHGRTR